MYSVCVFVCVYGGGGGGGGGRYLLSVILSEMTVAQFNSI